MEEKGKTLEELKAIKEEVTREDQRVKLSIELNICPVCGSKIIQENKEILDKPKKYLFGLIVDTYQCWDLRKICEKDKSHYENKYNYDVDCY